MDKSTCRFIGYGGKPAAKKKKVDEIDKEIQDFIDYLRGLPNDDARTIAMYEVGRAICKHCGRVLNNNTCYCTRDD